jgi:peptide/nickel transport system substrate-binding protein
MKRREFNTMLLTGLAASGFGLLRDGVAYAQTPSGGLTSLLAPEPPMLVLPLNQQQPTVVVGSKIYEGLLDYDFDLTPRAQLAERWEVSEDGLTYTFHLARNVKWHDGEPFTAADVIFTCTEMLPETHPRGRAMVDRCESITAADEYTVLFKLKTPFAAFLYFFQSGGAPIAPKHIYQGTDFRKNPANDKPIGTGPFMFKEWVRGSHIHLVANPDYYLEGKPGLTEIFFRVVPDAASRSVAMETGEAQLAAWNDVESFDVQRLAGLPHMEFTTKGYEFFSPIIWYEVNLRKEPFNDLRFRKAMMHLLDRQFIVDRIMFGLAAPATGPIASTTRFFQPDLPQYEFDVDKANAMLDEMGLKRDAGGKRATIRFLVAPYGEVWTRLAEYFRQAMSVGGIEVILDTTDIAGWGEKVANWDYEVSTNMLYQTADPAIGVSRAYVSSNIRKGVLFSNTQGYENPEVDRLFEEAAVQTSDAARQERYTEVQKLLVEEVPVLWMTEQRYPTLYDKRITGLITGATGVNSNFADARYL